MKRYSGVGVVTKMKPQNVVRGMQIPKHDGEGRLIRFDIGDITFINSYFPSGSSGEERQSVKMEYLDDYFNYIHELKKEKKKIIISGDYNICHEAIDIHDPKGNKDSSGFLCAQQQQRLAYRLPCSHERIRRTTTRCANFYGCKTQRSLSDLSEDKSVVNFKKVSMRRILICKPIQSSICSLKRSII